MGISPDLIVARVDRPLEEEIRRKISLFCSVPPDCVIENRTVLTLYEAPLMLEESRLSDIVCRELSIPNPPGDLSDWREMLERIKNRRGSVQIALVGKYVRLHDAYLSVAEALRHGGYENGVFVEIRWVDSEELSPETADGLLGGADGIILPGGFGGRGIDGMLCAADYARERGIPYFGICLGMQVAVVSFARQALGFPDANSREFDPDGAHCVIDLMESQQGVSQKGGTMRLGAYPCRIKPGTRLAAAYGETQISERHRHRYEFSNAFRAPLEAAGLTVSGVSPSGELVEAVELPGHPFYVGVQFHPEFKSRPNRAHPLFREFIRAAKARREQRKES